MAAQFMASYALPVLDKYKPTVNASYTYVSGDKNVNQNYAEIMSVQLRSYTAWDPFNEAQGSGTIYNTLFPLTNMHILALGASVAPLEDVTASFTWSSLWAAQISHNGMAASECYCLISSRMVPVLLPNHHDTAPRRRFR